MTIDRAAATGLGSGRGGAATSLWEFFLLTATGNRADAAIVVAGTADTRPVSDYPVLNRVLHNVRFWG